MRNTKKIKKHKTLKIKKLKNKKGGTLRDKCLANHAHFPKCGKEGCVFLEGDDRVVKQQWIPNREMPRHLSEVEAQRTSVEIAPSVFDDIKTPCNLITKKGHENEAPCFVKRFRKTKNGDIIEYQEENRDSWCRSYGKKEQCVVDNKMYERFKHGVRKQMYIPPGTRIPESVLPDVDSSTDGDPNAIEDEDLGDLHNDVVIPPAFTIFEPIFLTQTNMERIKGITINELLDEILIVLGKEKADSVKSEWEEEKDKIVARAKMYGYNSKDFHGDNIMIDVGDEKLCEWIDTTLEDGIPISPEMIKDTFKKMDILKIVDWGHLEKVQRNASE
jgi:hypothetical protein